MLLAETKLVKTEDVFISDELTYFIIDQMFMIKNFGYYA